MRKIIKIVGVMSTIILLLLLPLSQTIEGKSFKSVKQINMVYKIKTKLDKEARINELSVLKSPRVISSRIQDLLRKFNLSDIKTIKTEIQDLVKKSINLLLTSKNMSLIFSKLKNNKIYLRDKDKPRFYPPDPNLFWWLLLMELIFLFGHWIPSSFILRGWMLFFPPLWPVWLIRTVCSYWVDVFVAALLAKILSS